MTPLCSRRGGDTGLRWTRRAFMAHAAAAASLLAPSLGQANNFTIPNVALPKRNPIQRQSEAVSLYVACLENAYGEDADAGAIAKALGWHDRVWAAQQRAQQYHMRVDLRIDVLTGNRFKETQRACARFSEQAAGTGAARAAADLESSVTRLVEELASKRTAVTNLQAGLADDLKLLSQLAAIVPDEGGLTPPAGLGAAARETLRLAVTKHRTVSIDAEMAQTAASGMAQSLAQLGDGLRIVHEQAGGMLRTIAESRDDPAGLRASDYAAVASQGKILSEHLRRASIMAEQPLVNPFAWTAKPTLVRVIGFDRFKNIYGEWGWVQRSACTRLNNRCDALIALHTRRDEEPRRPQLAALMADSKVLVRNMTIHEDWVDKWDDKDTPPVPWARDSIDTIERGTRHVVVTGLNAIYGSTPSGAPSFVDALRLLKEIVGNKAYGAFGG